VSLSGHGDDINWEAPWLEASLLVELPFWPMADNGKVLVETSGHLFEVTVRDDFFEWYGGRVYRIAA
jgi:hypothetical protein